MVINRYFNKAISVSINQWIHVAMLFKGHRTGEGITVYLDGNSKGNDMYSVQYNTGTPSGIVKIGRWLDSPGSAHYGSVYLDELLFWNQQMSPNEIWKIWSMG